eukprot:15482838-Alexandrium_andersonii.AAC.1
MRISLTTANISSYSPPARPATVAKCSVAPAPDSKIEGRTRRPSGGRKRKAPEAHNASTQFLDCLDVFLARSTF